MDNILIDVHTHHYSYSGSVLTLKVAYNYENFQNSDLVGVAPQYYSEYRYDLDSYIEGKLGVGEVGLDYHWAQDQDSRKLQREVFSHQLQYAEKLNFVEIHCRDAFDDLLAIMSSYKIKLAIFHFYSGNLEHYKKIIDRGWYISIPPRESSARKKAVNYDLDHVMCETDSPYIIDSPDKVYESYKLIAKYTGQGIDRIVERINNNVLSIDTLRRFWKI